MTAPFELLECPLCSFSVFPDDDYVLHLHFEQVHTTDSPFRIDDDPEPLPPPLPPRPQSALSTSEASSFTPSSDDDGDNMLVECPEPNCGESVLLTDFNQHLDYHTAETLSFDDKTGEYHHHSHNRVNMHGERVHCNRHAARPSFHDQHLSPQAADAQEHGHRRKSKKKTQRGRSDTSCSEKSTLSRSIQTFNPFARTDKRVKPPSSNCRLGRNELGPHAWEDRMPRWLHEQLDAGPKVTIVNRIGRDGRLIKQEQIQNETPGIIPILAQLSALDRTVKEAYYCHPSTLHIGKTPKEGGFCGYRNIQMLISYIQGARAQGHEDFPGRTPGILKLQDHIERAWDKGINTIGRQQTGGIRDTRKYIGTPEAQALFLSAQIDCGVQMFSDRADGSSEAHDSLLAAIEQYFAQAAIGDGSNVYKTLLPPIYLQQPGHSITIVGFERRRDGSCNLMVFDPMYSTSPAMHKLIGRKDIKSPRPEVLYAYRRPAKQLKKHAAFEILMLTAHSPLFPAWDVLRQFPDLRFLYVFFRSRTLGFDVYPEDHFLQNFPWQQYGGLWIVDDARFARSEGINPITAQALRRITSEGASSYLSSSSHSGSLSASWNNRSFHQPPTGSHNLASITHKRHISLMSSLDGTMPSTKGMMFDRGGAGLAPVLDMVGMHTASPYQLNQSLFTDVGRHRYPGYPSPTSPTFDAKQLFPSPNSETGSGIVTPRPDSPTASFITPWYETNVDKSNVANHPRRFSPVSAVTNTVTTEVGTWAEEHQKWGYGNMTLVPEARIGGVPARTFPTCSSSRSPSVASLSPTSPVGPDSPRTAMLKKWESIQAMQHLSHRPNAASTSPQSMSYPSPPSSYLGPSSPPAFPIANGFETNDTSPLGAAGTMLSYHSSRSVDSGLLALKPLSEAQVAEYRFWRPCGKRSCAFGCGGGYDGENRAARKLFRSAEEVRPEEDEEREEEEEEYGEYEVREAGSVVGTVRHAKPDKGKGKGNATRRGYEGEMERERLMEYEAVQVRGGAGRIREGEIEGVRVVLNEEGEEVVEIRV